jgi:hypothetical protein
MIISSLTNGIARIAKYEEGEKPGFQCLPPASNLIEDAVSFPTVEEAAKFLRSHPSWGIRMRKVKEPDERPSKITKDVLIDGVQR